MYMKIHIWIYVYICIYIYIYMYTCIFIYRFTCLYTCMHKHIHSYMYISVARICRICIYTYTYVYTWKIFNFSHSRSHIFFHRSQVELRGLGSWLVGVDWIFLLYYSWVEPVARSLPKLFPLLVIFIYI